MGFEAGAVSGRLVEVDPGGRSEGTIDVDPVSGGRKVASTGTLEVPPLDIVTLGGGPAGFSAGVLVSAAPRLCPRPQPGGVHIRADQAPLRGA